MEMDTDHWENMLYRRQANKFAVIMSALWEGISSFYDDDLIFNVLLDCGTSINGCLMKL